MVLRTVGSPTNRSVYSDFIAILLNLEEWHHRRLQSL